MSTDFFTTKFFKQNFHTHIKDRAATGSGLVGVKKIKGVVKKQS